MFKYKHILSYLCILVALCSIFSCGKKEKSGEAAATEQVVTNFSGTYQLIGFIGQMQIEQTQFSVTINLALRNNVPLGPYALSIFNNKIMLSPDVSRILTGSQESYLIFSSDGNTVSAPMQTLNTTSFNLLQRLVVPKERIIGKKMNYEESKAWNAFRERNYANAFDMFKRFSSYNSKSFSLLYGKFASALMINKADEASKTLEAIKALPSEILNDEFFRYPFNTADENLESLVLINQGKNAYSYFMQSLNTMPQQSIEVDAEVASIINGEQDSGYRIKRKIDEYAIPFSQSIQNLEAAAAIGQFKNFTLLGEVPDKGKAMNLAVMYLLIGKVKEFDKVYEDAMNVYRNLVIIGQYLYNGNTFTKQIGDDYRHLGNTGLERLVETKYETEADLKHFIDVVRDLKKRDNPVVFEDFIKYDPLLGILPDFYLGWIKEEYVRIKLQLLELKAAAKLKRNLTGQFPSTDADWIPSLIPSIPTDPFSNRPMLYTVNNGVFTAYSVGPDGIDDKGMILYNPANGTVSKGDIVVYQK